MWLLMMMAKALIQGCQDLTSPHIATIDIRYVFTCNLHSPRFTRGGQICLRPKNKKIKKGETCVDLMPPTTLYITYNIYIIYLLIYIIRKIRAYIFERVSFLTSNNAQFACNPKLQHLYNSAGFPLNHKHQQNHQQTFSNYCATNVSQAQPLLLVFKGGLTWSNKKYIYLLIYTRCSY